MSKEQKTEVMSIEEQVKQQLALQSQKAENLMSKVNLISFKGGQLIVDGSPVPNGEAEVLVLAQQSERAYYEGEFDPTVVQVPACYSFDLETPHPESPSPQNTTCDNCPWDKWGSGKRGKGKGCRESARVAVIPASAPLETGPLYQCSFPITSLSSVQDFVSRCNSSGTLLGQYVTRLKVVPDPKTFFKASLTPIRKIEAQDLANLLKRMAQAREQLIQPYPTFEEAPQQEKKTSNKY